jgi:hypothetical protein
MSISKITPNAQCKAVRQEQHAWCTQHDGQKTTETRNNTGRARLVRVEVPTFFNLFDFFPKESALFKRFQKMDIAVNVAIIHRCGADMAEPGMMWPSSAP